MLKTTNYSLWSTIHYYTAAILSIQYKNVTNNLTDRHVFGAHTGTRVARQKPQCCRFKETVVPFRPRVDLVTFPKTQLSRHVHDFIWSVLSISGQSLSSARSESPEMDISVSPRDVYTYNGRELVAMTAT